MEAAMSDLVDILSEIDAVLPLATQGPWWYVEQQGGASTNPSPCAFLCGPTRVIAGDGKSIGYLPGDARYIAAVEPSSMRLVLAEILRLQEENARIRSETIEEIAARMQLTADRLRRSAIETWSVMDSACYRAIRDEITAIRALPIDKGVEG
jgi:hypothetical protein